MKPSGMPRTLRSLGAWMLIASLAPALPSASHAAPTLGFVESWPGTSVQGWGSIQMTVVNPGTGGVNGSGDGYLLMSRSTDGHFGVRSFGAEYVGDWIAAGISRVRLWLNDIDADQAFEVHFSLGSSSNVWQYDLGFIPGENQWTPFVVDLSGPAGFTQIIATAGATFEAALRNVQVVHVRHDRPPFMQFPDAITGELGLDELMLTNGVAGVGAALSPGPGPVELAPPRPNPSRGPVALSARTHVAGALEFQVVDLQGRMVRRAVLPAGAPGIRLWVWDGLDDRGLRVPVGGYRVRAVSASGGTSRSLTRLE